jgi:regulatory protein
VGDKILYEKAKQKAFRFLLVRPRSTKELRSKLKEKGFEEGVINDVIGSLLELKYLDDEAFAEGWARNLAVNRLWGNRKIERSLWEKGISRELIEAVIVRVREEIGEKEAIQRLVEKKCGKSIAFEADAESISPKEKRRLIQNLMGRSFPLELIFDVLGRVGE